MEKSGTLIHASRLEGSFFPKNLGPEFSSFTVFLSLPPLFFNCHSTGGLGTACVITSTHGYMSRTTERKSLLQTCLQSKYLGQVLRYFKQFIAGVVASEASHTDDLESSVPGGVQIQQAGLEGGGHASVEEGSSGKQS